MTHHFLVLAALSCASFPAVLRAQVELTPESTPTISVDSSRTTETSTSRAAQAAMPRKRIYWPAFYASAHRRPLTPRDVSMREAVQSLGIDNHRFVRCELKDGTRFIGGIKSIQDSNFTISQGILNARHIKFSDLKQPPQPVPAVGEHFVNGMKWTGVVAGCIVAAPIAVALLPLIFTGVLND